MSSEATKKKTSLEQFQEFFLERSDQLQAVCRPDGPDATTLIRAAERQIMRDAKLQKATWQSILDALISAGKLGLDPSGALGEAHIEARYNSKAKITEASLMPGYKGIIKLILQSGHVTSIRSHVAYQNDECEVYEGSDPRVYHKLCLGDRGDPIGVYSIAKLSSGNDPDPEWMPWSDVEKIRSKSGGSNAWRDWPGEMARKTVIKRHSKQLPLSPLAVQAIEIDHAASAGDWDSARQIMGQSDGVSARPPARVTALKSRLEKRKDDRPENHTEEPPAPAEPEPDWMEGDAEESLCVDCGGPAELDGDGRCSGCRS